MLTERDACPAVQPGNSIQHNSISWWREAVQLPRVGSGAAQLVLE